jgi:multidrug efflux pump
MLIGLATKNSILIVEFANQLREQGLSLVTATLQACHLRFRPILMTAFSTIVGVLPLAIATGAGAASRQAIGTTVLGGMLVSTILTLFVVPVFYVIANNLQNRIFPPKVHNWEAYFAEADQLLGEENHAVDDHHTPHINGNGNGNGHGHSTHNDHVPTNHTKSEEKPFTDIYK